MGCTLRGRDRATERARVESSFIVGGPSSAVLVTNGKNVPIDTVSNDAQEPPAYNDTELNQGALPN